MSRPLRAPRCCAASLLSPVRRADLAVAAARCLRRSSLCGAHDCGRVDGTPQENRTGKDGHQLAVCLPCTSPSPAPGPQIARLYPAKSLPHMGPSRSRLGLAARPPACLSAVPRLSSAVASKMLCDSLIVLVLRADACLPSRQPSCLRSTRAPPGCPPWSDIGDTRVNTNSHRHRLDTTLKCAVSPPCFCASLCLTTFFGRSFRLWAIDLDFAAWCTWPASVGKLNNKPLHLNSRSFCVRSTLLHPRAPLHPSRRFGSCCLSC